MQSISFLIRHIYTSVLLLLLILTLKILPTWSAIPEKYCPVENISYLFHHIYLLHNFSSLFLLTTYFWHINLSSKMKTDLLSVLSRLLRKWKENIRRRLQWTLFFIAGEAPSLPLSPLPKANPLLNLVESGSSLSHSLSFSLTGLISVSQMCRAPSHPKASM